ncbi:glycosyl transferase [Flavobacterium sp. KMS]|uniref:glycosyltransferase family 2 protein n=1 Tax=Flavobacterium sp. KMS TaxID=1566023 RepID=UPI00057C5178|nr:glycosyltransferase family A protein [Flavobacterium sp. KMS]KIA99801.1 glycosyl transferase [Flavobacterium sp. KMS]
MIVVYHLNNKITSVVSERNEALPFNRKNTIALGLLELAFQFPLSKIVWCNQNYAQYLNLEFIANFFHHNKLMMSYSPNEVDFLGRKIGYIDESPFIKINKDVSYPTWQMSSLVGVVHSTVLLEINKKIKLDSNFNYYLNSIAKVCMPLGLLCYSEPKLLLENEIHLTSKSSNLVLFRFVKQHYRTRWIFLLFLNLIIYEFKFPLLAFLYSITFKNRNNNSINLDPIKVTSSLKVINTGTIDVIIPTIGRKEYLYDVLKDLSQQTHLPKNVIIVEQNPLKGSVSELEYLTSEDWPFVIKHTFTHQAGACNARNVALNQVESEWVFLNDDDNRFDINLIENVFNSIEQYGILVLSASYLQPNEKLVNKIISQSGNFGSGNSFLKSELLEEVSFSKSLEFGYGEDTDFGLQLRNKGADVLYFPEISILHLKAPMGGFRIKPTFAWDGESIQPKPSPTIMFLKLNNYNLEQINGFKTILFFKYYKIQNVKNPLKYFFNFKEQWKQSLYWANRIIDKS